MANKRYRLSQQEEQLIINHRSYTIPGIPTKAPDYTLFIISDTHGIYCNYNLFDAFLNVVRDNKVDEILVNGDILDLPTISRFSGRLLKTDVLKHYSILREIEQVRERQIIPLLEAMKGKGKVVFREGNHCLRLTRPDLLSKRQLEQVIDIWDHYSTKNFGEILMHGIADKYDNWEYDPDPKRIYFPDSSREFVTTHGLSLSQNSGVKNIQSTGMSSGSTGHNHALRATYLNTDKGHKVWLESGHIRTAENVEYLPNGVNPSGWTSGWASVKFSEDGFFGNVHPFVHNQTEYNGKIYKA